MYLVDTLYVVVFPKGRKSWVAKPILEKKFDHLYHMMEDVAQLWLNECKQELLDYDKPDSIPQNIACPSKELVVAQHISRFPAQAHSHNSAQH